MKRTKAPTAGPVSRFRLDNGAVLLVKEEPGAPVVALNIWIEAGSVDERPDERGMAHLIEHMIFKGTAKRGVGEISRQVEAAGGYLNAFTSFEHTCFYVVLPGSEIEKALDIELDAYLNSTFDGGELAKEKEVVFEEMRMRRDDPWSWSWEILFGLLFTKNPYHWPVIGDMDILREVPRERLQRYYHTHYVPSNTVISVVGNASAPQVHRWIAKKLKGVRRPAAPERKVLKDPEPSALKLHLEAGDVQQIYLSVGFPTVPMDHPDSAPLEILAALLGDGASSRFNLAIRERTQSADDLAAEHFSGKYGGAIVFQALTDQRRLEKCLGEVGQEVRRISLHPPKDAELQKVKNRIKAAKVFEKQNMDGQAKTLGFWELQGGYEMEEGFLKALDSVTVQDLSRVSERYLQAHRASLLIYHPKGQTVPGTPSSWEALLRRSLKIAEGRVKSTAVPQDIHRVRLANGDILWVKERKNLPLVSIGVFMPGGFVDEKPGAYGITSLMTRCLQKGTRTRSHEQFSREVEGMAAHLDTTMDKDHWGMTLDVLEPQFDRAFELFREGLWEPAFEDGEVAKETKMQLAAIARIKDDPSEYAMLHSDVLTFRGTPYAHKPLGEPETLARLKGRDLREWHGRYLKRGPKTWIAVGDLDRHRLKDLLDGKLLRPTVRTSPIPGSRSFGKLEPKTLKLSHTSQQANLVLGFRAPAFHAPDYFAFRVLNTLLNGMGGRLFMELREKRSLAYSVFAAHDAARLSGIYQIYIGCDPSKADKARVEMERVLYSLIHDRIRPEELERAKTYMTGLFEMGLQSNRSQVLAYARYEMSGKGAPWVKEVPSLIRQVTLKDVRAVAQRYLGTDDKTWVLLDPADKGE